MITVLIMEPCCEKSAPWYKPKPKPHYVRTPGWSDSCLHAVRRVPTLTVHETRESADAEYCKTRGPWPLDGWLFDGVMPPEGERFRIMSVVGGGGGGSFHRHGKPWETPFPTVDMAREHAKQHRESLINIVGDGDTVVRWSSYGVEPGTVLDPGDMA